jgi:uncharacterized protein YceK
MDLDDEITQSGGGKQKREEPEEGILKRRLEEDRDFDEDEYVERRRKMLDDAYEEARGKGGREDHREPLLPGEPPSIEQNEATMAMISAAQPISVIKSGSWFASPIAATESGFGGSYAGSYSQNSDFSRMSFFAPLLSLPSSLVFPFFLDPLFFPFSIFQEVKERFVFAINQVVVEEQQIRDSMRCLVIGCPINPELLQEPQKLLQTNSGKLFPRALSFSCFHASLLPF